MNIVVKQRDNKDCGICCLQSIILYYKGYVPLEKLRIDACVSKKGTTAYHLIETLKRYAFKSYGKEYKNKVLNDNLILPAIAHLKLKNNCYHFVVILKITKNKVQLMDPAKGKISMEKTEFLKVWTGVILFAIPKSQIPKLPKEKHVIISLINLLKKYQTLTYSLIIISALISCFSILFSFYFKLGLVNIKYYKENQFLFYILLFALIAILKIFCTNLKDNITNILQKNIEATFLNTFLSHLFKLPITQYQNHTKGELLARIREAKQIENGFLEIFTSIFIDLLFFIISLGLLFFLNYQITLILLVGSLFYLVMGIIFGSKLYQRINNQLINEEIWNNSINENLDLFKSMKYLNQTDYILEKLEYSQSKYLQNAYYFKQKLRKQNFWKKIIFETTNFVSGTFALYLVLKQKLTIYDFIFFQSILTFFFEPIEKIINLIPNIYYLKSIFSKISEFSALEIEKLDMTSKFNNGVIYCKDLKYSYDKYALVIDNVSFKIGKGKHVLLNGKSGSGKSTICKILQKQLDNYEGTIKICGKNLKDYSLGTIRKNITYLSQKEELMNATIEENIVFGRNIDDELLKEVCDICHIEEIVNKKVARYQEIITKDENNLSGGERQRIILARALLNQASIYLLDECLSEVDKPLEISILKDIFKYLENKTLIYISHKQLDVNFDEVITIE